MMDAYRSLIDQSSQTDPAAALQEGSAAVLVVNAK